MNLALVLFSLLIPLNSVGSDLPYVMIYQYPGLFSRQVSTALTFFCSRRTAGVRNKWTSCTLLTVFFPPLGANGPGNLQDQQLRAIENGLTLFRCISQGISGIIEPVIHGHFEQKTAVISNQVALFNLPLQKRIKTVYSAYLGDSVPLACILYSLKFLASLLYHHLKGIGK